MDDTEYNHRLVFKLNYLNTKKCKQYIFKLNALKWIKLKQIIEDGLDEEEIREHLYISISNECKLITNKNLLNDVKFLTYIETNYPSYIRDQYIHLFIRNKNLSEINDIGQAFIIVLNDIYNIKEIVLDLMEREKETKEIIKEEVD